MSAVEQYQNILSHLSPREIESAYDSAYRAVTFFYSRWELGQCDVVYMMGLYLAVEKFAQLFPVNESPKVFEKVQTFVKRNMSNYDIPSWIYSLAVDNSEQLDKGRFLRFAITCEMTHLIRKTQREDMWQWFKKQSNE